MVKRETLPDGTRNRDNLPLLNSVTVVPHLHEGFVGVLGLEPTGWLMR